MTLMTEFEVLVWEDFVRAITLVKEQHGNALYVGDVLVKDYIVAHPEEFPHAFARVALKV